MKNIFTLIICTIALTCNAQHYRHHQKKYDFSKVDPATIDKEELNQKVESARISSGYDSLKALEHYIHVTDDDQFATLAIGYQHAFASFDNLRRELSPFGFNNIKDDMSNFLVSLDLYKNRFMMSYIFTPGFRNLSSNEDYELRIRRRAFEAGIGYDLIGNKHFDLFPQVSIGFQDFNLRVEQKDLNVNSIPDLLDEMVNTSMRKRSFIFTYGAEFDYKFYTKDRGRIILGVRYAQVVEPGDGRVRVNGEKSDLKIDDAIATSTMSFVIKMVPGGRHVR
ncbi:MAG TPA: hypothetical protein VFZ52_19980 [Chryseolinea sp.]